MSSDGIIKPPWKWLIAILALVAAGLSIWLTIQKLNGSITSLAGCSGGGDCANVLGSKWSMVLGLIPVSLLSSLLYLAVLVSLWLRGITLVWLRQLAAWMIIGSAVWFTVLQIVMFGAFCKYCMTMHGVGVLIAVLILVAEFSNKDRFFKQTAMLLPSALMFVFSLAGLQYFSPEQISHRVEQLEIEATEGDVHSHGEGREVAFFQGKKKYKIEALPHLGSTSAEHVMVKYFDYTCEACRDMHEELDVLLEKYDGKLAVIVLPTPLNKSCNPHLPEGVAGYDNACEFAQLSLRVWRADPEQFEVFHEWLFENSDVPAEAAEAMAAGLVGQKGLPSVDDSWINDVVRQNVDDYKTFSQKTTVMPKLAIKGSVMMQGAVASEGMLEAEVKKHLPLE